MAAGAVEVRGLRELDRAFGALAKNLRKDLRNELKDAVEPVRGKAEEMAVAEIRNIGDHWSRMRVGVSPGVVYVAPVSRRRGGSPRPNLAPLLLHAMEDALDQTQGEVVHGLELWLTKVIDEEGF